MKSVIYFWLVVGYVLGFVAANGTAERKCPDMTGGAVLMGILWPAAAMARVAEWSVDPVAFRNNSGGKCQ